MKQLDQLFADIAREHLGIPTLATRLGDALDFHDVAVWSVLAALKAAYEAGLAAPEPRPGQDPDLPKRFDGYEIQPCRRYLDAEEPGLSFVEPCEPHEADFWTVYGHVAGEGVHAIGDFEDLGHAEEIVARITGRPYRSKATNPTGHHR